MITKENNLFKNNFNFKIMKTTDFTNGKRPKNEELFRMTVEFHNGKRYSFYGKTKKEAEAKFKEDFGNYKGFTKREWIIM